MPENTSEEECDTVMNLQNLILLLDQIPREVGLKSRIEDSYNCHLTFPPHKVNLTLRTNVVMAL